MGDDALPAWSTSDRTGESVFLDTRKALLECATRKRQQPTLSQFRAPFSMSDTRYRDPPGEISRLVLDHGLPVSPQQHGQSAGVTAGPPQLGDAGMAVPENLHGYPS